MNELFAAAMERQKSEILVELEHKLLDRLEPQIQQLLLARHMTIAETAQYLHVSDQTVRRLVGNKTLPSFRVRNQIMVRQIDVDNWIEKQIDEGR